MNRARKMTEDIYRITPKGFITSYFIDHDLTVNEADDFWNKLTAFTQARAKLNGMDGIPCLILVDGGHCITAEGKKELEK